MQSTVSARIHSSPGPRHTSPSTFEHCLSQCRTVRRGCPPLPKHAASPSGLSAQRTCPSPVWSQAHGQFLQGSFPWPGGTDWSRNSRGLGSGEVWYRQPRGRGCHQESCETLTSSVSCRLPTTSTKAEGQAGSTRPGSQSASPVMVPEVSAAAQQVGGDACTWLRAQSPGHQGKVRTGPPSPGPPEGWVTRQTTQQLW